MIIVNNIYVQHNDFNVIGNEKEEKKQGVFVMEAWKKVMELDDVILKNLWNKFINESGMYEDSNYIYDFNDKHDIANLVSSMTDDEYGYLLKLIGDRRYFQVVSDFNGSKINLVDPKEQVNLHWSEILARIINFPCFYQCINEEEEGKVYYFYGNVILPLLCEKVGVEMIKSC